MLFLQNDHHYIFSFDLLHHYALQLCILKNLRLKELNFKEINEFLNKEYNIIDEYEININKNIENEDIKNR